MSQKAKKKRLRRDPDYKSKRHSLRANSGDPISLCAVPVTFTSTFSDLSAEEGVLEDKVKEFEMLAYSGGKLFVDRFPYPVVVDLQGVVVKAKGGNVNVTLDHLGSQRVGHTTSVEVAPTGIKAKGVTSASTDARDEVLNSAKDGFGWQASIEGRVVNKTLIRAGNSVRVNGRQFQGPIYVARKFVLSAISFVSSGGDEENEVKIAAESGELDMSFAEWVKARGFDIETLSEVQLKSLKSLYAEIETPSPPEREPTTPAIASQEETTEEVGETVAAEEGGPDRIQQRRDEDAKEDERQDAVRKLCAGAYPELQAKAIREGMSEAEVGLEILRAKREEANIGIHAESATDGPNQEDVLTAALCINSGVNVDHLDYPDEVKDAAQSGDNKNASLHRLMYDTIRAAGMSFRPGSGTDSLIRAAVEANRKLEAAGAGFSTTTLPGVLGNLANKALLAAYNAVDLIATQVCGTRDVNDFKLHSSYRVTTQNLLDELGPDGEIKHTHLAETTYTNQLKTYARMMALTRHDMINDDLGALRRIASGFGRVAAQTLDHAFHTELLANTSSFFHADNNNYLAGTDTVLQITSLTSAAALFLAFVDDAGYPMRVNPSILLVSNSNDVTAGQLFNDIFVNETTTANKPKPSNNPHVGKYRPVTSPWLSLDSITGYSDTAWYLIADPNDIAFMEVAYLRGQRAPTIESSDTVFNTLGMQWRAYHDFGIAFQDTSGAVKMKGAAA